MTEKPVKTLLVRLPVELKEWLKKSVRNLSSQGSEIVRLVRQRIEKCPFERRMTAAA